MTEANQGQKVKIIIDFDKNNSNSIKALSVKKITNIKVISRFMNCKMLMFAKVSLISFVYDVIDVFAFPNEHVKGIVAKNDIMKCHLYLTLTDTESASIFFVFVCKIHSLNTEVRGRELIFQILIDSKLLERLDPSDEFWLQFHVKNPKLKKSWTMRG